MTTEININQEIQEMKSFLVRNAFSYGWNTASRKQVDENAQDIIYRVSIGSFGLASEIAGTVLKYNKLSEKQAYWIAKAAVENNIF